MNLFCSSIVASLTTQSSVSVLAAEPVLVPNVAVLAAAAASRARTKCAGGAFGGGGKGATAVRGEAIRGEVEPEDFCFKIACIMGVLPEDVPRSAFAVLLPSTPAGRSTSTACAKMASTSRTSLSGAVGTCAAAASGAEAAFSLVRWRFGVVSGELSTSSGEGLELPEASS